MQMTEVKKKKYSLTREEISAIKQVIDILEIVSKDDGIREAIQYEAYGRISDQQDILNAILSLDETDIDC